MALTRTLGTGDSKSASPTHTLSYTPPSGTKLLIVRVVWRGEAANRTISSATYAGSAMTLVDTRVTTTDQGPSVAVYKVLNPASGANNIVITYSGNSTNSYLRPEAWGGLTPDVKGSTNANQGGTTNVSISLSSTLLAGEYAIDVWNSNNSRTWTIGSNQTYDYSDTSYGSTNSGKTTASYSTTNGKTAMTHTLSSNASTLSGVSYIIYESAKNYPISYIRGRYRSKINI